MRKIRVAIANHGLYFCQKGSKNPITRVEKSYNKSKICGQICGQKFSRGQIFGLFEEKSYNETKNPITRKALVIGFFPKKPKYLATEKFLATDLATKKPRNYAEKWVKKAEMAKNPKILPNFLLY